MTKNRKTILEKTILRTIKRPEKTATADKKKLKNEKIKQVELRKYKE